jgi:hypothetical protein
MRWTEDQLAAHLEKTGGTLALVERPKKLPDDLLSDDNSEAPKVPPAVKAANPASKVKGVRSTKVGYSTRLIRVDFFRAIGVDDPLPEATRPLVMTPKEAERYGISRSMIDRMIRAGRQAQAENPMPRVDTSNPAFALGRLKTGEMNKTEEAYAKHLEVQKFAGEVLWWKFEGVKLRLADNTFLTVDFSVMRADGLLEMHEVKGHWEDDARVKIKVAASLYPFRFIAVKPRAQKHGGGWEVEEF